MAESIQSLDQLSQLKGAVTAPDAPKYEKKVDKFGRAYATGKRKDAVARVWIKPGSGKVTVNTRDIEVYFARPVLRMMIQQPLVAAARNGQYDVICTVAGGGLSGQAGAVRHGLSKALTNFEPELRGVKGEMILIETAEVQLARPVRLMHPRWPLYLIPRADNLFMLGATSLEAEDTGVSLRSALELLGAAYSVHPAFGEARILEFGSGLRPAYPDNLPRITVTSEREIRVNGLYRHGFLIAPALAQATLNYVAYGQIDNEVMRCA